MDLLILLANIAVVCYFCKRFIIFEYLINLNDSRKLLFVYFLELYRLVNNHT